MTTYDYIVRQRRRQQQAKAATALSSAPTTAREVERVLDDAAKSTLAVSNITDNPGYDDFSEVGEEVVDSIEQLTNPNVNSWKK